MWRFKRKLNATKNYTPITSLQLFFWFSHTKLLIIVIIIQWCFKRKSFPLILQNSTQRLATSSEPWAIPFFSLRDNNRLAQIVWSFCTPTHTERSSLGRLWKVNGCTIFLFRWSVRSKLWFWTKVTEHYGWSTCKSISSGAPMWAPKWRENQ